MGNPENHSSIMTYTEIRYPQDEFACRCPFTDEWTYRRRRLEQLRDLLFHPKSFSARLVRIQEKAVSVQAVDSEIDLEENLLKSSEDTLRILSICQQYSLDPLQCTEDAMMQVISSWGISAMFVDVLLKFGNQPRVFEECSGFRQTVQEIDGSFEICYQMMYVEPSGRTKPRDPWSFRQTGVEHKYVVENNRSVLVLLHPKEESEAQKRLETLAYSEDLAKHPLNVHLVILSAYMAHWQDHMEDLAETLQDIRKHILVINTHESSFEAKELQRLKNIEDKILCRARRCLKSTHKILESFVEINARLQSSNAEFATIGISIDQQLQLLKQRLETHIDAAEMLGERVTATLGLLTNMLDLQNQASSDRISTRILKLTKESVDDNATVRVITVCTLIYLPASFTATFFGMNFFEFSNDLGAMKASPNFWLYIAATIPLTLVTVGAWYLFKLRYDQKRKQNYDEEATL